MQKALQQAIQAVKIGITKPKPRIKAKKIHPLMYSAKPKP